MRRKDDLATKTFETKEKMLIARQQVKVEDYQSDFNNLTRFLLDSLQGSSLQVEILFICLSVITSNSFPYSDSKLTQPPPVDLSHASLPRYPMSPIHVSHARQSTGPPSQSTGPPMNRIISQTFLFPFGVELCASLTFLKERTDFNCKQSINRSKHGHIFQKLNKVKAGNNFDQKSISYRFGC